MLLAYTKRSVSPLYAVLIFCQADTRKQDSDSVPRRCITATYGFTSALPTAALCQPHTVGHHHASPWRRLSYRCPPDRHFPAKEYGGLIIADVLYCLINIIAAKHQASCPCCTNCGVEELHDFFGMPAESPGHSKDLHSPSGSKSTAFRTNFYQKENLRLNIIAKITLTYTILKY